MGVGVQRQTPAALSLGKTRYPLLFRATRKTKFEFLSKSKMSMDWIRFCQHSTYSGIYYRV